MLVKPRDPRPGETEVVIVDPRSRIKLPVYGGKVPDNRYWVRRRKCGDTVLTTQETIHKGKAEAEPTEEHAQEPSNVAEKPSHHSKRGKGRS